MFQIGGSMTKEIIIALYLLMLPSTALANCISGNCFNGNGVFVNEDNDKYVGSFENGKFTGKGKYYYSDGGSYKGMFKYGQFEGIGTYIAPDEKKYEGEWKGGLPNGQGSFLLNDKSILKGQFKNGKLHGFGSKTFPDGTFLEGIWKKGEFIEKKSKASIGDSDYSREDLTYFVNENAKNLPIKTDSVTTITGIMLLTDNTILWRYKIDLNGLINQFAKSENLPIETFKKNTIRDYGSVNSYVDLWKNKVMENSIITINCSNPSVRKLLDGGVKFKHSYSELDGTYFFEVSIDRYKCD